MTAGEWDRYSRQIRFAGWGEDAQERLRSACVAVAGCGALGSFAAGALVRAGAGRVILVDRDYVELSNLQRQWLYDEEDAARALPKAVAAAAHLRRVNSTVAIEPVVADLTAANIAEVFAGVDLIVDGTDNFETRYLINDFAVHSGVPWVYGAAVGSYGLTMAVVPDRTACFCCVYPAPPEGVQATCETAGVLGPITSVIASLESAAALTILAGQAPPEWITTVDVWTGVVRQVRQPARDPECRACGRRDFTYLRANNRAPVRLCGRNAVQIHDQRRAVDLEALRARLEGIGDVRMNEFALRFVAQPFEVTIFADGRAIIKGTEDPGVARSVYARYVGA